MRIRCSSSTKPCIIQLVLSVIRLKELIQSIQTHTEQYDRNKTIVGTPSKMTPRTVVLPLQHQFSFRLVATKVQISCACAPSPILWRMVRSSGLEILLDGSDGILGAAQMRQHDRKRGVDTGQSGDGVLIGLEPSTNLNKAKGIMSERQQHDSTEIH
jgi:hypothetical protein